MAMAADTRSLIDLIAEARRPTSAADARAIAAARSGADGPSFGGLRWKASALAVVNGIGDDPTSVRTTARIHNTLHAFARPGWGRSQLSLMFDSTTTSVVAPSVWRLVCTRPAAPWYALVERYASGECVVLTVRLGLFT